MAELTAIILAAGLSRRMGARNKLLLPVHGVPMIRHVVATYRAAIDGRVLVVTGHDAKAICACLTGCDVQTLYNPDFATGQQSSVACGLRAAASAGPILIGLGDQPALTASDLRALLTAHADADPGRISIPAMPGRRGNPVVVPAALRGPLLADPRSPGCKAFTRAHPERVQFHPLPSPGFYADVDTPEAYDALIAHNQKETT